MNHSLLIYEWLMNHEGRMMNEESIPNESIALRTAVFIVSGNNGEHLLLVR
jgi:hypothetical protein